MSDYYVYSCVYTKIRTLFTQNLGRRNNRATMLGKTVIQPTFVFNRLPYSFFPAGGPVLRNLHKSMPCAKVLNVKIVGFVLFISCGY